MGGSMFLAFRVERCGTPRDPETTKGPYWDCGDPSEGLHRSI